MLERIKPERRWQWAAYGKHPAAKDYFKIGSEFPLFNSFSNWIENGYQVLASRNKEIKIQRSWRFWTKEARKENMVCGVVRDSNDSLGRPHPLLIMGTGPLKDWTSQWDLVPLACENAWIKMEYLSTMPVGDLRILELEVQNIKPPVAEWLELARKREGLEKLGPVHLREPAERTSAVAENMDSFIPLDQALAHDHFELIGLYHSSMRARTEAAPSAIFMGGTAEKSYIAFFKRPLAPSDFIHLWSVTDDPQ